MVEAFNDDEETEVIASKMTKEDFHHAISLRAENSSADGHPQLDKMDFMKRKSTVLYDWTHKQPYYSTSFPRLLHAHVMNPVVCA